MQYYFNTETNLPVKSKETIAGYPDLTVEQYNEILINVAAGKEYMLIGDHVEVIKDNSNRFPRWYEIKSVQPNADGIMENTIIKAPKSLGLNFIKSLRKNSIAFGTIDYNGVMFNTDDRTFSALKETLVGDPLIIDWKIADGEWLDLAVAEANEILATMSQYRQTQYKIEKIYSELYMSDIDFPLNQNLFNIETATKLANKIASSKT